jgi:hypothetical protein
VRWRKKVPEARSQGEQQYIGRRYKIMANHVSNYLAVQGELSEAGQKVWNEFVVEQLEKDGNLYKFIFDSEEEYDRGVMCERIGAKWAVSEDFDESGVSITSAWGPVGPFAEMVAEKIGEVDPDVRLALTYEDEMPNFVGVATFTKDGMEMDESIEHEEILELVLDREPQLREWYDEDAEEWIEEHEEEAMDLLSDVQWDVINEWQQRIIWDV